VHAPAGHQVLLGRIELPAEQQPDLATRGHGEDVAARVAQPLRLSRQRIGEGVLACEADKFFWKAGLLGRASCTSACALARQRCRGRPNRGRLPSAN
jgi:hypothetical protein